MNRGARSISGSIRLDQDGREVMRALGIDPKRPVAYTVTLTRKESPMTEAPLKRTTGLTTVLREIREILARERGQLDMQTKAATDRYEADEQRYLHLREAYEAILKATLADRFGHTQYLHNKGYMQELHLNHPGGWGKSGLSLLTASDDDLLTDLDIDNTLELRLGLGALREIGEVIRPIVSRMNGNAEEASAASDRRRLIADKIEALDRTLRVTERLIESEQKHRDTADAPADTSDDDDSDATPF